MSRLVLIALLGALLGTLPIAAQTIPVDTSGLPSEALPLIGSPIEDRARIEQLLGERPATGFLIRSLSTQLGGSGGPGLHASILDPSVETVWNSDLPFTTGQSPLWAGRGYSSLVTAGFRIGYGPLQVIVAPQVEYIQNLDFQTIPPRDSTRSRFASPWHFRDQSADLPLRPGDAPIASLGLGQSSVNLATYGVRIGLTTENEWWGPGLHNAIVMSNNAEGIPRAFASTDGPVRTPIGSFEGRWIVGALLESPHFDIDPENDVRALSGMVATYSPRWQPYLTFGAARTVYSAVDRPSEIPSRALDAITWWRNQIVGPDSTIADPDRLEELLKARGTPYQREQLFSLFGRWIFPDDGFEVYAEWARTALPSSPIDFLNEPYHSQGYTLGLQFARPLRNAANVRFQGEATYLEQSSTFSSRPVPSFYVSEGVPQGYTNRGQSIGAQIGPGGSSQWLAGDYLGETHRAGAFGGRIRRENDVYYRGIDRFEVAHDVTLYGGLRAGTRIAGLDVGAEFAFGKRYNYLFQNALREAQGYAAVDRTNRTVRLILTPAR